eukprot:TRINITY_DN2889_c0_g1_i2.p1 TRINITY_DN2889_c0_g1~~TRINITY_DN2889_c0_g1_i2.p1  ORF type:complete len:326 (+),score=42.21 TRINITY_DN2889_c0_g1_i2:45-1022(+)
MAELYDVVVVGGGLSGMVAALRTMRAKAGLKIAVLEASDTIGGRLKGRNGVDGGGAWVWPRDNPLSTRLIDELGLKRIPQPGSGPGQDRVDGGMYQLPVKIAELLDAGTVRTNTPVTKITHKDNVLQVSTKNENLEAKVVIIATPPRVTMKTISFDPQLPREMTNAARATPAWMSKVSKTVMTWSERFWESADVFGSSYVRGPGFQFYDASTRKENVIVAFCSPLHYTDSQIVEQTMAFISQGTSKAPSAPSSVTQYAWVTDRFINEDPNDQGMFHLSPNPSLSVSCCSGRLLFAGTETSFSHPGYIEGAIEAAQRAAGEAVRQI